MSLNRSTISLINFIEFRYIDPVCIILHLNW